MKIADIRATIESIRASDGPVDQIIDRQRRELDKLQGLPVVKVISGNLGIEYRSFLFKCEGERVELYQYTDGSWDLPFSDDEETFSLEDLKNYHRAMGAAIRFAEADEPHWKKKCEVEDEV